MKKAIVIYLIIVTLLLTAIYKANAQTWTPNPKYTAQAKEKPAKETDKKYQCWGTTKAGERCKRKVKGPHDFCYQHQNQQQ